MGKGAGKGKGKKKEPEPEDTGPPPPPPDLNNYVALLKTHELEVHGRFHDRDGRDPPVHDQKTAGGKSMAA